MGMTSDKDLAKGPVTLLFVALQMELELDLGEHLLSSAPQVIRYVLSKTRAMAAPLMDARRMAGALGGPLQSCIPQAPDWPDWPVRH